MDANGFNVSYVVGNAAKAGIREGDVILAIDGKAVLQKKDLWTIHENRSVGDELSISVARKGLHRELTLVLEPSVYRWGPEVHGDRVQQADVWPRD